MAMAFMRSPLLLASGDVERGKGRKNISNILYYSVFDLSHLYFQYAPRHIFPSRIPSNSRDPANRFLPSHIFLVMQPSDPSESSFAMKQNDDKLPHDASVFVGRSVDACHRGAGTDGLSSLPSNIDQGELTRLLLDHLSEHIQIKNIKVVRDSKGGVCAFVQCEV